MSRRWPAPPTPRSAPRSRRRCGSRRASAVPVGPSADYAKDVERALAKLERTEKSAARELNNAGRRATQVAATTRLASAYTGAAKTLDGLDVSPADAFVNAQLVAALRPAGAAYKKAAAEGRAKDRNGFKREGGKALAAAR